MPGDLEREMGEGQGEWISLSVDARSVMSKLRRQGEEASDGAGD